MVVKRPDPGSSASIPSRRALLERVPKRLVVKVGSAVLQGQPGGRGPPGLDGRVLMDLVQGLSDLIHDGCQVVLVSSGAILAGRQALGLATRPQTLPEKQACAALGQIELMARYRSLFEVRGIPVAQILLTADDFQDRQRFLNARNTLQALHERGILPIVNENDTVSTQEIQLGDNDNLSCLMLNLMGADLLVLLSDVNGLHERDPKLHPDARPIPVVAADTLPVAPGNGAGRTDRRSVGTGGILTKVDAARRAVALGVPVLWACGKIPRVLPRLLAGEEIGTFFPAAPGPGGSPTRRKAWLASIRRTRGRILVDHGAARALRELGKSLLPRGIVGVEGEFSMGDLVIIVDPDHAVVGRGLVSYSSEDVRRIQGLHSTRVGAVLGRTDFDEVVHRDNFVVS